MVDVTGMRCARRPRRGAASALLAVALAVASSGAEAAWQYRADGIAGQAYVRGSQGTELVVDCGNGGFPAVFVDRGAPWLAGAAEGETVAVRVVIDGQQVANRLSCAGASCMVDFDTVDDALIMSRRLRQGADLRFGPRQGVAERFSLAGSSGAIRRMAERGCKV